MGLPALSALHLSLRLPQLVLARLSLFATSSLRGWSESDADLGNLEFFPQSNEPLYFMVLPLKILKFHWWLCNLMYTYVTYLIHSIVETGICK